MSKPVIRFCLNGSWVEESAVASDMTVLRYLRTLQTLSGTKEGCGSGDCGACSVLVGEKTDGKWQYQAINGCISFVAQLDGKSLITVDALATKGSAKEKTGDQLHPAQQAMVDYHGSQCGFCTPGIVMSLAALHENQGGEPADHHQIIDALSGNLCRCTGYRPIIEAAENMSNYHNNSADAGQVGIWQPEADSRETSAAIVDVAAETEAGLFHGASNSDIASQSWSPKTEDELKSLLAQHPEARMVAGGTDIALEVTQMNRRLPQLIAINDIASLKTITIEDDSILIGAGVTYSQMEATLNEHFPEFGQLLHRFASRQVRNNGTMGGNVANASPIGDTPPVLLALDACIELASTEGNRWLPLHEFFLDYKKTQQKQGEYLRMIRIPRLQANQVLKVYKISKRLEDDISAVLAAFKFTLADSLIENAEGKTGAQTVTAVSSGFGGMAGIPKAATKLEQALLNKEVSMQAFEQAADVLDQDFTPMTDVRATSEYRMQVAKNLIQKCAFELSNPNSVTRIESLDNSDLSLAQVVVEVANHA
ncbi:MAG: xanthine dehydrogenase small subunit [Oleispira sp.]|nr:xanthine dehydrogenase small subunit [Oleispira sp.]